MSVCDLCPMRLFNTKHYNLRGVGNPYFGKCIVIPNVDYDAYKKGEEISKSYYEDEPDFKLQVNTAFASSKKADVIGFFVGDYHIDAVEKSSAGIPYILTGNAVMYYASYNPNSLPREDGDKSELLFDVMTINRKERTIHITRVGAGEDRIVKY